MMQNLKTELKPILSNKEIEVVMKRLNNKHLTQTESNYMSRSIRPKLRAAKFASSLDMLSLLDYRRKKHERERNKLKNAIITSIGNIIHDVKAIILFGSYVRNKHTAYNDIDAMVVLDKKLWKTGMEMNKIKKDIEERCELKLDVQLIYVKDLKVLYPYSPLLQTQLEEYDIIYGSIRLPKKMIIDKLYLYKELLEVDIILEMNKSLEPRYLYSGMRKVLAIQLFLDKNVDNRLVIKTIENNIGRTTLRCLQQDTANKIQKDMALRYLRHLYTETEKEVK